MKTIYLDFNDTNTVLNILDRYGEKYCLALMSKKFIKKGEVNDERIVISDDLDNIVPVNGLKILFDKNKEYSSCMVGDCVVVRELEEIGSILEFYDTYDYKTLEKND